MAMKPQEVYMLRREQSFRDTFHEGLETSGSPTNEAENVRNPTFAESLASEQPRSSAHVFE
jgi:hypothetical protein